MFAHLAKKGFMSNYLL
jgi:hypothetical protein